MTLTNAKIEEIRAAADLADVASDYVQLRKSGSKFLALCPFHNEKTPSFNVDPQKGLYYCFGCLEENELIWTSRGLVPIGEVQVGDVVMGMDGQREVVTEKVVKRGKLLEIELDAVRRMPLRLTPDHTCFFVRAQDAQHAVPMLYHQQDRGIRFQARKRAYGQERTCPIQEAHAEEVKPGDFFLFPIIPSSDRVNMTLPARRTRKQPEMAGTYSEPLPEGGMPVRKKGPAPMLLDGLPVNEATARLYGLWLAEGSLYRGGIRWSFHRDEEKLAEFVVETLVKEFGLTAHYHRRPERTLLEVTCSNTQLSYLFQRWFGKGAAGKQVPFQALFWAEGVQRSLVEGYFDGDGRYNGKTWCAYSISKKLIEGLYAVAIQAGLPVSMGQVSKPTKAGNPVWSLTLRHRESTTGFFHPINGQRYYWMQVKRVQPIDGEHTVVDISVTGSHTFTTHLGVVHNCQAGGDIFSFVQRIESVGFTEAARMLAERFNIALPEEEDGGAREKQNEVEEVLHALRFAARFFFHQMAQTEEGKARGLAYFKGRGFTKATIKTFGLGYAPDRWDGLLKHAAEHHIPVETLEKAGLVLPRQKGDGYYDRYRGRAIFPIFSHVGKVLGFGGRILEKDPNQPKYINSPETLVYHKSEVLYGLHQAKQAIRAEEEAILVEGYTDVISLHQAGVKNAVASSGTALTPEQVKLIGRYAKRVLLVYDADNAGQNATLRGIDLVLEHGLAAYVLALPEGADPDSYVQQYGAESFRNYAKKHRQDFIHFKLEQASRSGGLATPEGKADTVQGIVASIARIPDVLRRETYLREASAVLKITEATLHRALEELLRVQRDEAAREERREQFRAAVAPEPAPAPQPNTASPVVAPIEALPSEKTLIRLMLEHGLPLVELILGNMALDEFTDGPAREAATRLLEQYQQDALDPQPFLNGTYGEAVQRLASGVLVDQHELSENWKRKIGVEVPRLNEEPRESALSAMTLLKMRRVKEAEEQVQRELFQAQQDGQEVAPVQQKLLALHNLRLQIQRREFLDWNTV